MSTSILATKLYVPPHRPNAIVRTRLLEHLNTGLQRKLTLLSAPAGFGKTTLVTEWIAAGQWPVAWLSLDEGDNEPVRFLTYFVAALQTLAAQGVKGTTPNMGDNVLAMLQSPHVPPTESILTNLINELATIENDFILVLDDYHVIDLPAIDKILNFILEYMPPQMHVAVTTREDPQLPLSRLRARAQMTELRISDLRFTSEETSQFLNNAMGLSLSGEEIKALEVRTEGWITGLQLAAISMRSHENISEFIHSFSGSHRFVLDYLVEEVLNQQPLAIQDFLLNTSILDRFCGPLCDAVLLSALGTGTDTLAYLEQSNLFIVSLDNNRLWYRYHHLFGDLLRGRLREKHDKPATREPASETQLHKRASRWYEQNGAPAEAIHHALAAEDFEWAANLSERVWRTMDRGFQSAMWLAWVKALPDELVRARPVLSVGYAWALLTDGKPQEAEARLRDAEFWLAPEIKEGEQSPEEKGAGMVVVDEEEFRVLPASIASARAYQAQMLGDMPGTVHFTRLALDLLPEDDHLRRAIPAGLLGLTYFANGDLEPSFQIMFAALDRFRVSGDVAAAISGTFVLADIRLVQGHLREAIAVYQRALEIATDQSEFIVPGTADLFLGLSELYREQGNEEAAKQLMQKSENLGEQGAQATFAYHRCLAQAGVKEDQGDFEGAILLLDEAALHFEQVHIPDFRPSTAAKARLWIKQGQYAPARAWVAERNLSVDDELTFLREFEHITLARLLVAQSQPGSTERAQRQATDLLARLLLAAEQGERTGSVIEILLLQAISQMSLNGGGALRSLERALALAEPEGFVRLVVNEGPPMETLLREAAKKGIAKNYVSHLLGSFHKPEIDTAGKQPHAGLLTERELEVLRMLQSDLTGPQIAGELMVSLNTLRTHTKNIYAKLGVKNRRAAVRQARTLHFL